MACLMVPIILFLFIFKIPSFLNPTIAGSKIPDVGELMLASFPATSNVVLSKENPWYHIYNTFVFFWIIMIDRVGG